MPVSVDFQAAFVAFWAGNAGLVAAFPGKLHDGAAGQSTPVPFAVATFADPERGLSLDDVVFDVTLVCYGITDAGAKAAARAAASAVLSTPARPAMEFAHDGRNWRESGALRVGAAALSQAFTLDDGREVWRSDQTFRFDATAVT